MIATRDAHSAILETARGQPGDLASVRAEEIAKTDFRTNSPAFSVARLRLHGGIGAQRFQSPSTDQSRHLFACRTETPAKHATPQHDESSERWPCAPGAGTMPLSSG
jgi:hypothetical protein